MAGNLLTVPYNTGATYTVDKTPPPAPVFTLTPPDPNATSTSNFKWSESESGVTFLCSSENGAFQSTVVGQPCASPLSYVVQTTNNGQHQFGVEAVDAAGNVSQAIYYSWKVGKGSLQQFSISGNVPGRLYPGATAQKLNLTVTNPNPGSLSVTSLTVSIQSVTGSSNTPYPCTASDFQVVQIPSASLPFTAPPGTSTLQADGVASGSLPTIQMIDRHDTTPGNGTGNQNGCIGATITLSYSGGAQG